MATIKGEDAKITINGNTVAYCKTMSISFGNQSVERKYFQDDASSFTKTGESCTVSVTGDYDSTDTAQAAMLTALFSSDATLSGIKFYEDGTNYWEADTNNDADAIFMIDSFNPSFDATDIVSFTAEFKCSGNVHRTS